MKKMTIGKVLVELSWCKDIVNILEVRANNKELDDTDLKMYLKKLNAYLDILEQDVENM